MENINFNLIFEAAINSTILKEKLYPVVSKTLDNPSNRNKFKMLVGEFIDKNSNKLHTPGPQYLIPFTDVDKNKFYNLFDTDDKFIKEVLKEMISAIGSGADWVILKNNPIVLLFANVVRYYDINNLDKEVPYATIILTLSMYPMVFAKYFTFEPNDAIMQYTIDNLSLKSTIKKEKHIFGTLVSRSNQAYDFHKKDLIKGEDGEIIRYINRIRNDMNSFMKKISIEFYKNHKENIGGFTSVDSFEDQAIVDVENDSNRVSLTAEKITTALIINGPDQKLAQVAANACKVSMIDLRNYLNAIVRRGENNEMDALIESILFLFLYKGKRNLNEIRSQAFLEFSLMTYKKANSKDKNILNIKRILDTWANTTGLTKTYSREATLNDYKRALYMFFIFTIQKYS